MKNNLQRIAAVLLAVVIFASCKKDKPEVEAVDLQVILSYPANGNGYTLPLEGIKVKLTNLMTGSSTEQTAAANGQLTFAGLAAGNYDIDASITIPEATFAQITGTDPGADVTFNASAKNTSVFSGYTDPVNLQLISGKTGGLVIKQVYYAGSDTKEGALFRDQFVEIYNNSSEVIYADSLYFGRLWGKQSATATSSYYQSNGQLDWSKSQGMPAGQGDPNKDYVYIRELLMIPGTGTQYPIQPGSSIVIAQNAMNHKQPFVDLNGKTVSVGNPDLTIDLSNADFEVYYGNVPGISPLASDIDNPAVDNMEVVKPSGRDMILDNLGRDSYVIFKAGGVDIKALPSYFEPLLATPSTSANQYVQLPVTLIEDAVEIESNIATSRTPKKLLPSFDAGYTFATDGSYSSQSVIRKTEKTENGRTILKDSNNSTEDFVTIKANPKGFAN